MLIFTCLVGQPLESKSGRIFCLDYPLDIRQTKRSIQDEGSLPQRERYREREREREREGGGSLKTQSNGPEEGLKEKVE